MTLENKYIDHVERCFENAEKGISKINQEIIDMDGMTGTKTRHFYNNLLSMEGVRYLEIGVWKGSSSCAAMFGNKADVVLMDNWQGFGGPKDEFMANFKKFKGENNAEFVEADCFAFDVNNFTLNFNIYTYDSDHSEISQYKGVEHYLPTMDSLFIYVVDDWNWLDVRNGTLRAIHKNKLETVWSKEIRLTDDNEFTHDQQQAEDTYWNGIAVFILKQNNK